MAMVAAWIEQYGYGVLFLGLLLELIALPFPGETAMGYAGFLVYQGKLSLWPTMGAALLGTTLGMTAAYWIGRKWGAPVFEKVGLRYLMKRKTMDKTMAYFEKYGAWLVFFAYFVPGVRHFTGYLSGITKVPFRRFAFYAYSGAVFWVLIFVGLGRLLGPQWERMLHLVERYTVWTLCIGIGLGAAAFLVYLYLRKKK